MANGKGHSGHAWRTARNTVLSRRPLICAICLWGIDLRIPYPHPYSASVHCVIPASRGGSTRDTSNLVPAHLVCNQKLGNRMPFNEVEDLEP